MLECTPILDLVLTPFYAKSPGFEDGRLMTLDVAIRAMQVVAQEQAAAAAAATLRREAHKERQVTKALEASKMRSERAIRVAKLKVGFSLGSGRVHSDVGFPQCQGHH